MVRIKRLIRTRSKRILHNASGYPLVISLYGGIIVFVISYYTP